MLSSIKARVIAFYMVVLFLTLSALGVFLYFSLHKIVYNSIDSGLLSRAKALATLVTENDNETEFKFSDDVMWEYNSPKSKSFFQIRRFDGTTLEKSASLRDSELPFQAGKDQTSFKTIFLNGEPTRLINFYVPEDNRHGNKEKTSAVKNKGHGLVIQCAEDIEDRIDLIQSYSIVLSLSIVFIMIISASGSFLIAKKALTPIKEISETIDRISESNLSERVTEKSIPSELKGLAASFNRTFDSLENAFNRQKQFAADASHELRTPLSVIISQGEIALRKERNAGDYKDALTAIVEAARMMSEIVQKLLTIARLGTDKFELKMEDINIGDIVHESVKLLRPLAEQRDIAINISAAETFTFHGDHAALLELFTNLIDNAIKYNIPQGKIDISIRKERDFIETEIRDTGIGISEGDLDRVFDRFYRVDKARSKENGGVGLGLSICNEIVMLHGGRIEIKSKVGEGTNITVYLKGNKDVTQA
ncbi:MAG: ATP-binding protein [Nitrospirae bacterium]|nr:ATP-binding protein [Nitrospirota bacterium]